MKWLIFLQSTFRPRDTFLQPSWGGKLYVRNYPWYVKFVCSHHHISSYDQDEKPLHQSLFHWLFHDLYALNRMAILSRGDLRLRWSVCVKCAILVRSGTSWARMTETPHPDWYAEWDISYLSYDYLGDKQWLCSNPTICVSDNVNYWLSMLCFATVKGALWKMLGCFNPILGQIWTNPKCWVKNVM